MLYIIYIRQIPNFLNQIYILYFRVLNNWLIFSRKQSFFSIYPDYNIIIKPPTIAASIESGNIADYKSKL
jgi:hypothetical protein